MSATGLDVFDKTLQTTNLWLDEMMEAIGPDRHTAWKVLSTVLHEQRDRLQPDLAAHLAAQLPLLVRGASYDLCEPARQPTGLRSAQDFVEESKLGSPTSVPSTRNWRSPRYSAFSSVTSRPDR